jgi:hypothetical protein
MCQKQKYFQKNTTTNFLPRAEASDTLKILIVIYEYTNKIPVYTCLVFAHSGLGQYSQGIFALVGFF